MIIYRQTGRLGTYGANRERVPQPKWMQIKCFFKVWVPGDGQDKKLKLEWHFYLFSSRLGNSVLIHPACPESPRLTVPWILDHGLTSSISNTAMANAFPTSSKCAGVNFGGYEVTWKVFKQVLVLIGFFRTAKSIFKRNFFIVQQFFWNLRYDTETVGWNQP